MNFFFLGFIVTVAALGHAWYDQTRKSRKAALKSNGSDCGASGCGCQSRKGTAEAGQDITEHPDYEDVKQGKRPYGPRGEEHSRGRLLLNVGERTNEWNKEALKLSGGVRVGEMVTIVGSPRPPLSTPTVTHCKVRLTT